MPLIPFDILRFFSESVQTSARRFNNREISWLAFNHRVLQEAKDPRNPLFERLKFLAIYSSNSDEFFRVRVASLRSIARFRKSTKRKYEIDPEELLEQIHRIAKRQQQEYSSIFENQVLREIRAHRIYLVTEDEVRLAEHHQFLLQYFKETVLPALKVIHSPRPGTEIFLQSRQLYLAVRLGIPESPSLKSELAIVELPVPQLPRFVELPKSDEKYFIMFLDDLVRKHLSYVFPHYTILGTYSIKLTRDAELYFDEELHGDFMEVLRKAVKTRKTGVPSRLLFDASMPPEFQHTVQHALRLSEKEMIPGGRYHNFSDFFSFPNPEGRLPVHPPLPPLALTEMQRFPSLFAAMTERDWMLHYPYHSYEPVLRLLEEAANDPAVRQIRITLYRVAAGSKVVELLIAAARNGKQVTAFIELTARFDEESNMFWAEELKNAKVKVLFTMPSLKVHCKLLLITRTEGTVKRRYGYLSTGNFNERTAQLYTDHGLFTSDMRLTNDMHEVFRFLSRKTSAVRTRHLLTAPFNLRSAMMECIDQEIRNAQEGIPAAITLKVNSLEDRTLIEKLYEASEAGVTVTIIARGICCLVPGERPFSKNITVTSIVGRFLEHGRIALFHNAGNDVLYLSSADWMMRNMDRRVETAFPIYDLEIKKEVKDLLQLMLADSVKARVIDRQLKNAYRKGEGSKPVESQLEIYHYLDVKSSAQHH